MFHLCSRSAAAPLFALAVLGVALGLLTHPGHSAQDRAGDGKNPLEGIWDAVSITAAGKEVAADEAKKLRLTVAGDKATATVDRRSKSGTIKVDASKAPHQFDLQFKGDAPRVGIYRLETDTLTLCYADDGKRPTNFEAQAGTRNVLVVLKRHKVDVAAIKKQEEKLKLEADKAQDQNNLKQIGLAMHAYHDTYNHLPMPAIYSKDGKPLLSWRVAILPFIEQNNLFMQFKQDEPWDGPNNKKLLSVIPKVYMPVRGKTKQPYYTYYQLFTGPGTPFEGNKKLGLKDILDGTSNTIMVVEAGAAVPWTKPEDLPYNPKKDLPKLGGLFSEGFNMGMCDGSVRWVSGRPNPRILRAMITRAGGEAVDPNMLGQGK